MRRASATLATFAALVATTVWAQEPKPIKALIITGDSVKAHNWKDTTKALEEILPSSGQIKVDVTSTPSKDLNDANLEGYDVLVLNYFNTADGSPESKWSDANKAAFLKAVKEKGKGLVVVHHASGAFAKPNWPEFEKAIAGGWRTQGFHGPPHEFTVKKTDYKHPVAEGAPESFAHVTDELYSNSLLTPGSVVLATAYCDAAKPKGTGKDEAVIWVNHYGKGRVFNCGLGHSVEALSDSPVKMWLTRGTEWAATGKVKKAESH
jgi:type 1 glutamine amidotransferase